MPGLFEFFLICLVLVQNVKVHFKKCLLVFQGVGEDGVLFLFQGVVGW